jgi:hypothetical protein
MEFNIQDIQIRIKVVNKLIKRFNNEYEEAMTGCPPSMQVELTEHIQSLLEKLKRYAVTTEEEADYLYSLLLSEDMELLKKYGKLLRPYWSQRLPIYFDFRWVLLHKEIFDMEEFNAVPQGGQALRPEEAVYFAITCQRMLKNSLLGAMLLVEPEGIRDYEQPVISIEPEAATDKAYTKSRQLLAIHYLLYTGFGLEPRSSAGVSSLARFAHLLTGTAFTNLQNSELYKKYLRMPNYKAGNELVSDLQFIRPYFNDLGITEAVKQIDAEISRAKNDQA